MSPDCHILVVEDEFIVALELITILTHEGAIVLGPAQTVQQALGFVARNNLDCALVDIRLADGASFAVADRLAENGVPFAFVTRIPRARCRRGTRSARSSTSPSPAPAC